MSDSDVSSWTENTFPSLRALREAHQALIRRQREMGDTDELLVEVDRLIQHGQATGMVLDADDERQAAQSLLDYWATVYYRLGDEPPDSTLADFNPQLSPTLADELCPYVGLDAFREADADKFFGRRDLIARLVERMQEQRLLAIVGPSGSGKSSLVQAGLIPALERGAALGSRDWRYYSPIEPGTEPLANLARLAVPVDRRDDQWIAQHVQGLQQDSGYLAQLLAEAGGASAIVVVDQFEQLFTLCEDESERQAFVANLLGLVDTRDAQHHVILTMRSDFETFVARLPLLQAIFEQGRVQITPLSAAELREAIERPAQVVGLKFEAGIVDTLLQDILGEPAGLPLLQFTLLKLWEHRERNRVTRESYQRVGGGRLALARSADEFYERLIPEEQVTARRILLRMVRPGEGLEITSHPIRLNDLLRGGEDPDRVNRVLMKLVDARLVHLTTAEVSDNHQVEVAHEALVRNWPTLVDWLEQERVALATRRRLEGRAAEWVRLGRGRGALLDAVELHEGERWLQSAEAQYLGYGEALLTFITASRAANEFAEREQEAARQRELEQARALAEEQRKRYEEAARLARRLRWLSATLLILVVITMIALALALIAERM